MLEARDLTFGYDRAEPVGSDLDLAIASGAFTVIVGPNACGKSTLLRSLARLLRPRHGTVVLDGKDISELPSKQVARRLGLLPQTAIAPDGITVEDLVARGRYPYQSTLRQWSRADGAACREAMEVTATTEIASRLVDELSGGQRQRVWLAMVLAQQTDLLLLDEPTTFLDISHQVQLMELLTWLNQRDGHTIVAVLHDLNQAARYASHVIAMKDGRIVAQGPPAEVVTEDTIEEVFDLACRVVPDPVSGAPLVLPLGGTARASLRK